MRSPWPPTPTVALLATGGLDPAETLCAPVAVAPGVGLVVDAGDVVAESSEDDNWLPPIPVPTLAPVGVPTCAPRSTPLAELSGHGAAGFVDLGGYPCWPAPGTRFIYSAVVANDGDVAAGPFRVSPPDWRMPIYRRTRHARARIPASSATSTQTSMRTTTCPSTTRRTTG